MDINQALDEVLANQLDIARQCVEDRDRRIADLQSKIELLERMLNRAAAAQYNLPQPQPLPSARNLPRRWSVR